MPQTSLLSVVLLAPLFIACSSSGDDSSATGGQGGSQSSATTVDGAGGAGGAGGTGGGGFAAAPTVTSNLPLDEALGVPTNSGLRATFSRAMDCASLTTATFTLVAGAEQTPVAGTVVCAGSKAGFWPAVHLPTQTPFTATITTGAMSADGVSLAEPHVWTFTSGAVVDANLAVDLGTAADFAILAKAAISSVPSSPVIGDIGISPAASSFITGFALSLDATNAFATSSQVTGKVFAADYAPPTPAKLTTAVLDMQLAFTEAAARAPDVTELGAGDIGGLTLSPGVYAWGTGLLIPTDVTLAGAASDVWVFQVAGDLLLSSGVQIGLSGGAQAENVFWQVAGLVDVGTTAHLEGVVLTQTAVTVHTGATVHGRLLAQTAVTLDGNAITQP